MLNKFKKNVGSILLSFLIILSTISIAGTFVVEGDPLNNNPPNASIKVIQNGVVTDTVEKGWTCKIDGSDSSDSDGDIVKYEWVIHNDGTWINTNGQNYKLVVYTYFGEITVSVRVTDSDGATDTASTTIRVINPNNKAPVADAGGGAYKRYFADKGYSVHFDGSGSYDPDPVVDQNGVWHSIERYDWKFFSGDSWHNDEGEIASHTYSSVGEYTITLRVWDIYAGYDTDTATVHVTEGDPDSNKPPVPIIAEDFYFTMTGKTVVFDGSESYDPDGGIIYHLWRVEDGDGWHESTSNHPPTTFSHRYKYDSPPVSGWYVQLAVRDNDCVLKWTTARVFVDSTGGGDDPPGDEPYLEYTPKLHSFEIMEGKTADSTTFEIWNGGDETLTYSLSENCAWASITPSSGDSAGEHDAITVNVNTAGLSPGEYNCEIDITSNGGSGKYNLKLNIGGETPPEQKPVEITKPKINRLYFGNKESFRFWNTIIFGPITILADTSNMENNVQKVEFIINNEVQHTATNKPYEYLWNKNAFGVHSIKVRAYDDKGGIEEDVLKVSAFIFGKP